MRRLLLGAVTLTMLLAGGGDSGNDYDPTADSEKEQFMTICATNGAVWERTYSGCRDAWREYVSLLSYMDEQFSEKQWKYDCVVDVAMRVAEIEPISSKQTRLWAEARECQGAPRGYCPWDDEVMETSPKLTGKTCFKWFLYNPDASPIKP